MFIVESINRKANRYCFDKNGNDHWDGGSVMKKHKKMMIVCLLLVVAIGFYFIGYKVAHDRLKNEQINNQMVTFYAEITDIRDSDIRVQGLDVNDINHRGHFTFTIVEETELVWNGTTMIPSELNVGDLISITYTGGLLETSPAQICEVVKVQLLDDNK